MTNWTIHAKQDGCVLFICAASVTFPRNDARIPCGLFSSLCAEGRGVCCALSPPAPSCFLWLLRRIFFSFFSLVLSLDF